MGLKEMPECSEGKKGRGEQGCSQTLIPGKSQRKRAPPSLGEDLLPLGHSGVWIFSPG